MLIARDIAAFVNVLGTGNPDLVWSLATVGWESEDDRNAFINEVNKFKGGVTA